MPAPRLEVLAAGALAILLRRRHHGAVAVRLATRALIARWIAEVRAARAPALAAA